MRGERRFDLQTFLLGAITVLLLAIFIADRPVLDRALAGNSGATGDATIFGVTGMTQAGGNREVIWVLDSANRRLAVYDLQNNNVKLLAARNITWDLKLDELPGGQNPGVKEIKKIVGD